ncbi:MAG: SDR family oxidoreductase [bacterium]|nr:SDR family oxidoreductase [bacterium]
MSQTRILILGGTGMLGHKLVQRFQTSFDTFCTIRKGFSTVAPLGIFEREQVFENVDVEDFESVKKIIDQLKPDVVVNAVGIIKQIAESNNVVQTLRVNSIFPNLLAELAKELDFRFITIGTDCAFLGDRGGYRESDPPDALDLYGRSKQYGEVVGPNCLSLRTSIIGRELGTAHSLVDWFLSRSGKVHGYSKAIFSGFPTTVLSDIIADVITNHPALSGLFHVSSEPIDKFSLLSLIKERSSFDIEIEVDDVFSIDRSLDSSRFRQITGFAPLPWPEMIDRMLSDPTPYNNWRKLS